MMSIVMIMTGLAGRMMLTTDMIVLLKTKNVTSE
jgi:hypothetical protein